MSQQILKADIVQKSKARDFSFQELLKITQQTKIFLYNRYRVKPIKLCEKIKQALKKDQAFTLTKQERLLLEIDKITCQFCKMKKIGKMLECERCENQYHIQCLKINEEQASQLQKYICYQCIAKEKKRQEQQQYAKKLKEQTKQIQQSNNQQQDEELTQEAQSELDLDDLNDSEEKKSNEKKIIQTKTQNGNGLKKKEIKQEKKYKRKIKKCPEILEEQKYKKQKIYSQNQQ